MTNTQKTLIFSAILAIAALFVFGLWMLGARFEAHLAAVEADSLQAALANLALAQGLVLVLLGASLFRMSLLRWMAIIGFWTSALALLGTVADFPLAGMAILVSACVLHFMRVIRKLTTRAPTQTA